MLEQKTAVAKPLLIVSPSYPPGAVTGGRTAEIRVRGTITTEGQLDPDAWERDFLCGQVQFNFCMGPDAAYRIPQCHRRP